jgi:phenylacetate-CoA ligase
MNPDDIERELFETFAESQYWPREKIEEYQRQRLGRLVRHARDHVPFYKDRLNCLFDRNGDIDWSRWTDVPVLTRQDVIDNGEALRSLAMPVGHGKVSRATTSGSTGEPLTVYASSLAYASNMAALHRSQSWHGVDWSRDILFWTEERETGIWPTVEVGSVWGPRWLPHSTGRNLRFNGDTPSDHVLDYIREHDIHYLSCRAKVAQVLAIDSERLGRAAHLDALFAFSTAVQDDEREDMRRVFDANILSFYSSKEMHLMAYQCPTGHHLHIAEERALIELLDDDGSPPTRGMIGRVVATNLFNWAQPLIRYVHGDMAVEGGRCDCGRSLRVLSRIAGRVTDMFRFPDGTAVAFALPENVKRELNIRTWQVAQVAPLELEVRYDPLVADTTDEAAIATAVRNRTHPDIAIRFRKTKNFLPTDGRKFSEYVNEMRLDRRPITPEL